MSESAFAESDRKLVDAINKRTFGIHAHEGDWSADVLAMIVDSRSSERARAKTTWEQLRRTEDQLIQIANKLAVTCGDGLPNGAGDTLANACVRRIEAIEAEAAKARAHLNDVQETLISTNSRMEIKDKALQEYAAQLTASEKRVKELEDRVRELSARSKHRGKY